MKNDEMSLTFLIMEQSLWGQRGPCEATVGPQARHIWVMGPRSRGPHINLTTCDLPECTWAGPPGNEPGSKWIPLATQSETTVLVKQGQLGLCVLGLSSPDHIELNLSPRTPIALLKSLQVASDSGWTAVQEKRAAWECCPRHLLCPSCP